MLINRGIFKNKQIIFISFTFIPKQVWGHLKQGLGLIVLCGNFRVSSNNKVAKLIRQGFHLHKKMADVRLVIDLQFNLILTQLFLCKTVLRNWIKKCFVLPLMGGLNADA